MIEAIAKFGEWLCKVGLHDWGSKKLINSPDYGICVLGKCKRCDIERIVASS